MTFQHDSESSTQLADVARAATEAIRGGGFAGDRAAQIRMSAGQATHDAQLAHLGPSAQAAYLSGHRRVSTPTDAVAEVQQKAEALMKSDSSLSKGEATRRVFAEDRALQDRYLAVVARRRTSSTPEPSNPTE